MRKGRLLAAVAASSLLTAASEPVRLQPSSKWVVDLAEDDSCRLIRTFGEGKDQVKLEFRSVAPDNLTLLATGGALHSNKLEPVARAQFWPADTDAFVGKGGRTSEERVPAALWTNIRFSTVEYDKALRSVLEPEQKSGRQPEPSEFTNAVVQRQMRERFAAAVTAIGLEIAGGGRTLLETGPMGDAVKVLHLCNAEQLRGMGLDPNEQDRVVRPAWLLNLQDVFSDEDYPRKGLYLGRESIVQTRLVVDAGGKVSSCSASSQIDAPEFLESLCEKIKARARFAPAELTDGTKARSYALIRVTFRLED